MLPFDCPFWGPAELRRPLMIGALGTSLTWGTDLPDRTLQAWPVVLQRLLAAQLQRADIHVLNGAMRATSADFAALCFDELWGPAWRDSRGLARAPRLDLAIIEYTWSSAPSQVASLVEAMHARGVPCVAVLYYHPVNVARLGRIKHDPTPWKGAENTGHQRTFARVFGHYAVPFVNTSVLNARYGHRAMLNTTRNIWSAAHLSPLGHEGIAQLLASLLLGNCSAAFRLPPPTTAAAPKEYFCRIGSSLDDLRSQSDLPAVSTAAHAAAAARATTHHASAAAGSDVGMVGSDVGGGTADRPRNAGAVTAHARKTGATGADGKGGGADLVGSSGWDMLVPADGRTPGLMTTSPNATLGLFFPAPAAGRFLSLGFEASYTHDGVVRVSCGAGCWCLPFTFDAHSRKKYTYLQRTRPVWIMPVSSAADTRCKLQVEVLRITMGRLMLKALTMSSPRSGNRSISTSSLYALQ